MILSGDGEALLVDPRQLYLHTYQIMGRIRIESKADKGDPWPSLFEVLWALMVERKKNLNQGRVNAFLHRNTFDILYQIYILLLCMV